MKICLLLGLCSVFVSALACAADPPTAMEAPRPDPPKLACDVLERLHCPEANDVAKCRTVLAGMPKQMGIEPSCIARSRTREEVRACRVRCQGDR